MTTLHSVPSLGTHPTAGANPGRGETRDLLGRATYDLLVIGGGILGITTAWHAAQSGLRVAMVDAGDFAGATSSASSKLLHGGLRYLQTGAVKLVAENHVERRAVSRDVAPHLAKPLTFYLRASSRTRRCPLSVTASAMSSARPRRPGTSPSCAPTACARSRSTRTGR
jgi:glycerol-3-phosphate dehydrogenase